MNIAVFGEIINGNSKMLLVRIVENTELMLILGQDRLSNFVP